MEKKLPVFELVATENDDVNIILTDTPIMEAKFMNDTSIFGDDYYDPNDRLPDESEGAED
jgi:hypothetical protein